MWLDQITVTEATQQWPPTERQLGTLLTAGVTGLLPEARMVIDARPPSVRVGSTATYRLLRELHLEQAAPVAVHAVGVQAAYEALESLAGLCPDGGITLLVTATDGSGSRHLIGGCLVAAESMSACSVPLSYPQPTREIVGQGFIDLLTAALGSSRQEFPAKRLEEEC